MHHAAGRCFARARAPVGETGARATMLRANTEGLATGSCDHQRPGPDPKPTDLRPAGRRLPYCDG